MQMTERAHSNAAQRSQRAGLTVVVCALIVAVAGLLAPHVTAMAAPAVNGHVEATPPGEGAATPDLIDAAHAAGEISADVRLLYLAYAVYEPDRLPARFQSDAPWYGTSVVAELNRAAAALELSASPAAANDADAVTRLAFLDLMKTTAATVCREQDSGGVTESANFYLNHAAISGGLTAQAYLDALETSFAVEVTSYGWAKPPYCQSGVGSCGATNPWGKYPVQAAPLGRGLYGYVTSGGGLYTGLVGDNPNTAAIETAAEASCMVLNNDYSGFPGSPQLALDATAAHEFVHSIQFGIGDPYPFEDYMWYESSAAYMEDDVFDGADDNYGYLWPTFDACLGEYGNRVYSNWLFFRYVAEHNGGTNTPGGGEDVMQQFWVNVGAGGKGQAAFDNALGVKGTNLRDTYHKYAIASRFMKSCPTAAPYCYEEAAGYLASAGPITDNGAISTIGAFYDGSLRNNYALNWIRLPTAGPYSVEVENLSTGGQFRVSIVADMGASGLQVSALPAVAGGNQTVSLSRYTPPAGAQQLGAVVTNPQTTGDDPNFCTANPYRLRVGEPGNPVELSRTYLPFISYVEPPPPDRAPVAEDTAILQGYPDSNFCNWTSMWAGYDDNFDPDGEIARSLIKFDLSEIPTGTAIASAALVARHVGSWDFPDRSQTITAYAINSPWSACSTEWNDRPGIGAAYGSATVPFESGGWYEFDITALAQGWINGTVPNHGIWLRGPEFSGPDSSWRSFYTANSDSKPYLALTYPVAQVESSARAAQALQMDEATNSNLSVAGLLGNDGAIDFCQSKDHAVGKCLASGE